MIFTAGEFRLINDHQRDFPLVPQPYAEIGRRHALTEAEVLATYRDMIACHALGRIGVVFRPNTVGASTLAAMAVPAGQLDAVARVVSALPEVNHNYQREHRLNLWFVVAAASPDCVERAIRQIEAATGIGVLRLPLLEEFHIDLGFDLADGSVPRKAGQAAARIELDPCEQSLVAALDAGVPLCARPFADLGRQSGMSEAGVIGRLGAWIESGVVRRIGTVVKHRRLGFRANAMVVWNVPDEQVGEFGRRAAMQPAVTLCYRRARAGNAWPYNLYCMLHGREHDSVRRNIDLLAGATGLEQFDSATLFSLKCFTQRGARYARSPAPAQAAVAMRG